MLDQKSGMGTLVSRELTIENTTFCNAHCQMCPRDQYSRSWTHMDMTVFQESVRQGVKLGVTSLDICGFGDPLMDPDFETKMEWAKAEYPFLNIYTATTGDLLSERRLPRMAACLDTVKFSHYGFSAVSYAAVHGGSVRYERAKENILRMLSLPRSERPYVIVSFLILPPNQHEVGAWRNFWEPKADEITIWKPHNYGGAWDYGHKTKARAKDEKPHTCGRPFKGNPYVRTSGEVSVCCFDFDRKLVVGNFLEEGLAAVLTGEKMRRVQDVHNQESFAGCGLLCDGCDQIYDRSDALVYSNNPRRKVGITTTHPDLVNDLLAV